MSNEVHLARYITIAADIAERILRGEYKEGQKIFGRSTLAGKYSVSPETIRRALTLLQEVGIVQVVQGVGVEVLSLSAAQKYLEEYDKRRMLHDIHDRMLVLLKERNRINDEISKLMEELLDYTGQLETHLYKLEEWKVLSQSPLVGKSLAEIGLDKARVLSIQRGQEELADPAPEEIIESDDILTIYGTAGLDCRQGLVRV